MKKPRVYLADLRHNFAGVLGTDCMPLGIAYIKAVLDRDLPEVNSRLFAYPEPLMEAIKAEPPDVLMVSNYLWNETLSLHFLDLVKRIRPQTLTIMGGPNLHLEPERQIEWFQRHPFLDAYILGEGEFTSAEILRIYLDVGMSLDRLLRRPLPSAIRRDPERGVMREESRPRHREVDEIPSSFLTGIQDEFFDGRLAPMIETNRGCPFQCTFCVQGTSWYTKVHYFSLDRIKEELTYIARRIVRVAPSMSMLRIADSNYGMFERDTEVSAHIGKLQREFGWPKFIDVTTGKNRPERVIRSVEAASGATVVYMAVQSLDDDVLRNVKRQNIKLEAYDQLRVYMRGRGLRSNSDLILGLPGETLQSHLSALNQLLDNRIDQMHNLQLLLLKGSEIETSESRQMFSFQSKFRLGPKNYGLYGGEKVFDIEEIVVSTDSLSFEDYLTSRKLHLICSVFWNDSWFEDGFRLTDQAGIPRSEVVHQFLPAMQADRGVAGKFLQDFVEETKGELFDSPEALREFYSAPDNFERLCRGEIGENLMYKYRAVASFHIWPDICALAMNVFRQALRSRLHYDEEFWEDFHKFVELKHAWGPDIEAVAAPSKTLFRYDIPAWMQAGCPRDPRPYQLPAPTEFEFRLSENGEEGMRAAFAVWSSRIQGLAKLVTRIQVQWQIRQGRPSSAYANERRSAAAAGRC